MLSYVIQKFSKEFMLNISRSKECNLVLSAINEMITSGINFIISCFLSDDDPKQAPG